MPRTTRAAVCHAHNTPLRIEAVTLRDPGPGEALVRLGACAICHSDITYLDGGWGGELPAIYGHEAAGTIEALGPGTRGYRPGDRVLVTLIRACGGCVSCAGGQPALCGTPNAEDYAPPITLADGGPVKQAMSCGAFAEAVLVHVSQLAVLPADMALDAASLLACGGITGIGAAVNTARVRPGQTAVVIGAGGVGLNTVQGCRIAGAARIIAVDLLADKLDAAREFGATHGVLATKDTPWDTVKALTHGRGADYVFVTVGVARVFQTAQTYLAPSGRLVVVGMPPTGAKTEHELGDLAFAGQGFLGSKMGDVVLARDVPWMVDLYQQGRLKLDEMISRRWPLEEINAAIADTKSGAARRNVIVFPP